MVIVSGANEVVIADVHLIPHALDNAGNVVNVCLGLKSCGCSAVFDLLTVLICAGAEEYVKALCSLVAGDGVGRDSLVSVADMGLCRSIRDCCCYIILRFSHSF